MTGQNNSRTLVGCLVFAIAFAVGCSPVGPDYRRPVVDTPDIWQQQLSQDVDDAGTASLETWWTVFEDPDLEDLIERARDANYDVRMAVSRVTESRVRLALVTGKKQPNVDLDANVGRQELSDDGPLAQVAPNGGFQPQSVFSVNVDAMWEIDVFGRVRRKIEAAGAHYQATVEDYRDVLITLLAEVALAYVDVRAFQQRIVIAESNATSQQRTLELAQQRFDSGLSSRLDVAQARSNLAATRAAIPVPRIGLHQTLNRLAVLLGEDAGSLQPEFALPRPIPSADSKIGTGVPADLLRQRPDVRQAERMLAAKTAAIGVATADLYPRFALKGFIGFQTRSFGNLLSPSSLTWGLAAPIHWNIFDRKRIRRNIEVKEAQADQALLAYEQSVLLALEEVENAIVGYNQNMLRRNQLSIAVDASRRAEELVLVQYDNGLTDFNNVLGTQRALFEQQDRLVESNAKVTLELIAMYKALGGGWVPE